MQIDGNVSDSDRVREWVRAHIVQPAKGQGRAFTVNAGEVHKALGLKNRVPLVCQALKSKRMLQENQLAIRSMSGPPSGLGTTLSITYEFLVGQNGTPERRNPLWDLAGIGKNVFQELGGGEAFIRSEREHFSEEVEERWSRKTGDTFALVWRSIVLHAGEEFSTVTAKPFRYRLEGDSVWIERNDETVNQNITRGQFQKAWERWPVDGPGELNDTVRGPSYVFAILRDDRIQKPSRS